MVVLKLCELIADKIGPTMAVLRQDIDQNIQVINFVSFFF